MNPTPKTIQTQLKALTQGEKAVFKNEQGKVKVFYLKSGYYFVTFDGHEIETITDLDEVAETVIALLKIESN